MQATFPGSFEVPEPFAVLPGIDLLVPQEQAEPEPDLVIVFDVAAESRLGGLVDGWPGRAASIVLDHHASNTGFGSIRLVDPQGRGDPRWSRSSSWTGWTCRWTRRSPSACTWRWPPTPGRSSST
jgi:hypothetical protein